MEQLARLLGPRLRLIQLEDRSRLEPKLQLLGSSCSSYTFANLFLFRDIHQFHVVDEYFICGKALDGRIYYLPYVPLRALPATDQWIYPIVGSDLSLFADAQFVKEMREKESEYLYETSKLATLKGLSRKRSQALTFQDEWSPIIKPFTTETIEDARMVVDNWKKESFDRQPCLEAIKYFQELSLTGWLVYVDDRAVAFAIGGEQNKKTFLLHFAKADTQFTGIYAFLFQSIAKDSLRWSYLNLEEDLGLAGLHQVKHSYHPCKKIDKWYVLRR